MRLRVRPDPKADPALLHDLREFFRNPTRSSYTRLYATFRDLCIGIMFVGYVRLTLRRAAEHLRRRERRYLWHEWLALDAPIEDQDDGATLKDRQPAPGPDVEDALTVSGLPDVPTHPTLARGISELTAVQQRVLLLTVCLHQPESLVARRLGTSQQNINRIKQRALRRLRKVMTSGWFRP